MASTGAGECLRMVNRASAQEFRRPAEARQLLGVVNARRGLVLVAKCEQPPGQLLPIGEFAHTLDFSIRKAGEPLAHMTARAARADRPRNRLLAGDGEDESPQWRERRPLSPPLSI